MSITATSSLWPFEQFDFRVPRHGATRAWLSRPAGTAQGMVVVIQSDACVASRDASAWLINPGGILWQQFKADFAFVQFQRPVADAASRAAQDIPCPQHREPVAAQDSWRRSVAAMLTALRRGEHFDSLPVIYIGIDAGASLAAQLAAVDSHAAMAVLMSAASDTQLSARLRVPVLMAHAADDRVTSLSTVMQAFERAGRRGGRPNLLIFEALDHDLGLSDNKLECFEAALMELSTQIRNDLVQDQRVGGEIRRFRCPAEQ